MPTKPHRTRRVYREPSFNKRLRETSISLLTKAQTTWNDAAGLDTAVRDVVAEGIAFIVYAAYDTEAIVKGISDFDCAGYIQQKTYQWFRDHDFVEWFCVAASTLFRTTPRCFYRMRVVKKDKTMTVLRREKLG